ncbi:MAG: O-antigen ligase family protein [Mariprofundaceae bacterium]|nr:O-antigen ligase family protein [Mariprofundaceae bacterium]
MLLYAASLLVPEMLQGPLLICGAAMIIVIAFTSVELTLYMLIFSTLLSPELTFGGGGVAEVVAGRVSTTASRGITLRLDDLLLTLVCLTWLFRMAIHKELGSVRETPINQAVGWYWLATFFATLIGFYSGDVGVYGFFFVLKYLEYFLLFYMVMNHLHDHETIKRFLMVMLFTCFIASLAGISQIPSGARVSAPFEGLDGEPNTFGGYLMLMFSLVLGMMLYTPRGKRRTMLVALLGIILVPFVFTESRSSYLSFVVAMALFIVFSKKKRLLLVGALVGLSLAPVVIPQNVIDRVMFTFTQSEQEGQINVGVVKIDTSTSARLESWKNVLTKKYPQNPFLGVGVTGGGFLDAQYPRVLLETGMIGLILFLWLLRRIWVLLRRCYADIEDQLLKGAALGAVCGYGGLLVHAIGANSFIIVRIMEPFMIIIGLLFATLLTEAEMKAEAENSLPADDEGLQSQPGR